jgi:hypothetical protein
MLFVVFTTAVHAQYYFAGRKPYVTQMHIHGWSNHNGAAKPGSLQYHNWQSDSVGVDVIWWSEHDPQFTQDTFSLSLDSAIINATTLNIENIPHSGNASASTWQAVSVQGIPGAFMSGDTLNMILTANTGAVNPEYFSYSPRSESGLIKGFKFPKPIACRPLMRFSVNIIDSVPLQTGVELLFRLAWHHRQQEGQDILIFNLVPDTVPATINTNSTDSVWVNVPVPQGWHQVNLDLQQALSVLDHGIDNTISDMELRLAATQGNTIQASFCDFFLIPQSMTPDSMIASEKMVIDDYSTIYHSHNILGVEYSGSEHLNGYFSKSVNNHHLFDANIYTTYPDWVNDIHAFGGLVSYNHLFGTDWTVDSISLQDYRSDTLAQFLLANQAYDSDIIEVGYTNRGGGDLAHHLATWDKLTANGLFLYGNGVSDSHGNRWIDANKIFHTYIWASDSSDTELLASLSLGKMFFGNFKYFQGVLYYAISNLEMGDRGFIDTVSVQPFLHVTQLPAGSQIRLTQILLDSTLQLTYIHNETLVDTSAMPVLNMSQPCFIRFGIYDSTGSPLAFGQPIVVLGLQTGIEETTADEAGFSIFPNPASDVVHVECNFNQPGNYSLQISDNNGRLLQKVDDRYFYRGKYGYVVRLNHLPAGIYFVELKGNKSVLTRKIIKL